jgi:hypothetical protein
MLTMNNQTFNPAIASQDRRFFNEGGGDQLNNSNSNGNSSTPVTAFLRGGAPAPGMMNFGNNGNGMGNSTQVAAMMNQMGNMNQNPQMQMNAMNNLNLNDLKRLQQLQQQLQNNTPSNPLLVPQGQQQQQDPSAAILQNYLDQKMQSTRFDDSLRTSLGMGGLAGMGGQNPMLGSNLFQERLMMNQNPMGQQGGNHGELPLPSPHSLFHRDGSRRMRGGVIEPFPEKLHRLLLEVEAAGRADVISFVANGRAFAIHKPDKFFKEIVPLYFRQSRLSSFKRQLNLYGFELINTGPARGGYYHELFVKDRSELCRRMRRVAVKVNPKEGSEANKEEPTGEAAADKAKNIKDDPESNQVSAP